VRGLVAGSYSVHILFPGYYPMGSDLLVSDFNPSYDLGAIRLDRMETFEDEITVAVAGIDTQVFRSRSLAPSMAIRFGPTVWRCLVRWDRPGDP
jgi:hypothetical protein